MRGGHLLVYLFHFEVEVTVMFPLTLRHVGLAMARVAGLLGHVHPLSQCSSGSSRFVLDPDGWFNIAMSL